MNKKELVKLTAEKVEMTQKLTSEVVDAVFEVITDVLAQGEDVAISDFGKFVIVEKEAATRRNPATNEPVEVPAHNVVKFKASSVLKEAVR